MRTFLLLLAITLVSCQTYQLVPSDFTAGAPGGTALGLRVADKQFYLEHLEEDQQQVVVDLEIINESSLDYFFSPEKAILFTSDKPFPVMDMENQTALAVSHIKQHGGWGPVKARTAREVNRFFEKKIRSQRAAQVAMLLLGTALVVADVVADAKVASKEVITQTDIDRSITRDAATVSALALMDVAGQEMEMNIMKRAADLEYLPDEYLGSQLLLPGSSARGKLFFPKRDAYRYYRFIMSIDGRSFTFDLRYPTSVERKALRKNLSVGTGFIPE